MLGRAGISVEGLGKNAQPTAGQLGVVSSSQWPLISNGLNSNGLLRYNKKNQDLASKAPSWAFRASGQHQTPPTGPPPAGMVEVLCGLSSIQMEH